MGMVRCGMKQIDAGREKIVCLLSAGGDAVEVVEGHFLHRRGLRLGEPCQLPGVGR